MCFQSSSSEKSDSPPSESCLSSLFSYHGPTLYLFYFLPSLDFALRPIKNTAVLSVLPETTRSVSRSPCRSSKKVYSFSLSRTLRCLCQARVPFCGPRLCGRCLQHRCRVWHDPVQTLVRVRASNLVCSLTPRTGGRRAKALQSFHCFCFVCFHA